MNTDTHVTPEQYLLIMEREEAVRKRSKARQELTHAKARQCPLPKNLRPATTKDLTRHAVLWYPDDEDGAYWCIVAELMCPPGGSAYIAEDGCMYCLYGAYVEIK